MLCKRSKSIWLKSLKVINLLKNKIGINIDFKYRLDPDDPDIFYMTVDNEEFECQIKHSDIYDLIILYNRTSNVMIGAAEIMKVGKVSMLRLDESHFLDDVDHACRVYGLNMELLDSIK